MIDVPQTMMNMSAPFKHLLRAIEKGAVIHGGNPVLWWAMSNVAPYYKGKIPSGAKLEDYLDKVPMMPSKQNSAEKIDPVTAIVLALARMLFAPQLTGAPTLTVI
jgi:phage terminase large subunit-like protein